MTGQLAKEELQTHWAQHTEYPRQLKWGHTIDLKHGDRHSAVAEHQWTTETRPPPLSLVTIGKLPILDIECNISIQDLELVGSGSRGSRRQGQKIHGRDELPRPQGKGRSGRGILVF